MAGRAFQDKAFSLDRKRVTLTAVIDFGASGAPTLKDWIPSGAGRNGSYADASEKGTRGIKSVTKNATGDFTIQLQDQYQRLLGVEHTFLNSKATSEAAPIMRVITDDTDMRADGGATVNVLFLTSAVGTSLTGAPGVGTLKATATALNAALTTGDVPFASDVAISGAPTAGTLALSSGATSANAANPGNGERVLITIHLDDSSSR